MVGASIARTFCANMESPVLCILIGGYDAGQEQTEELIRARYENEGPFILFGACLWLCRYDSGRRDDFRWRGAIGQCLYVAPERFQYPLLVDVHCAQLIHVADAGEVGVRQPV